MLCEHCSLPCMTIYRPTLPATAPKTAPIACLLTVLPLQARAALLTAAQCATYDELKLFFVRGMGWEDNLQTHFSGERAGMGGRAAGGWVEPDCCTLHCSKGMHACWGHSHA